MHGGDVGDGGEGGRGDGVDGGDVGELRLPRMAGTTTFLVEGCHGRSVCHGRRGAGPSRAGM